MLIDAEYGYYQYVTFTPNENVALFRDMIIEKATFESADWGKDGVIAYLQQDMPDNPWWDQYRVDRAAWNADPETDYYACAIGKNAKGEWGELATKELSTPKVDAPAATKKIVKRLEKNVALQKGVSSLAKIFNKVPAKPEKLQLIQK